MHYDYLIFGSNSPVGRHLVGQLAAEGASVLSVSRQPISYTDPTVSWLDLEDFRAGTTPFDSPIAICVFHIWLVPDIVARLAERGVKRLICLSSTSIFGKMTSSSLKEQQVRREFEDSERAVRDLCAAHGISLGILRPTLIYGDGRDKNIAEISDFIDRFGFFPVFGAASGIRQPVHARDVAKACVQAAKAGELPEIAYNIPGGEELTYRHMLERIFTVKQRRARILSVPIGLFSMALAVANRLPRFRHWTKDMAERMNQDLKFDRGPALRDFGYDPSPFALIPADVTRKQ